MYTHRQTNKKINIREIITMNDFNLILFTCEYFVGKQKQIINY